MKKKKIIYIHGFNSSGQATKSQILKKALEPYLSSVNHGGLEYYSPSLIHHPLKAMHQLSHELDMDKDHYQFCFVGSSLGGFYSIYLAHRYLDSKAILINPAIDPWKTMDSYYGNYENLSTGEKFSVTQEFVLSLEQFKCHPILNPQRFLLLLQTDDEVIDYRIAKEAFSNSSQIIRSGGGHRFHDLHEVLPDVLKFALE